MSVIAIDDALRAELDAMLGRSGHASLQDLFGMENPEERWIDGTSIDEAALRHLRSRCPL